jgi:hypothetical protein
LERQRFVPKRVDDLTAELCDGLEAEGPVTQQFRVLGRLISALRHYEFHARSQAVTEAWDRTSDDPGAARVVVDELQALLEDANYVRVTKAELDEALTRESVLPLRLNVDLDDYEELLVYRRGSHRETVSVSRLRGLRSDPRAVTVDERVVVYTRIKPRSWFDERGIDPTDRNLVPGHLSLKQFHNVPRANIEMLLPSATVRFRPIDSVIVGLPAVISGIAVVSTKLLPTLGLVLLLVGAWLGLRDTQPELDQGALVVLLGGTVTLGGFLARQWTKLKNRRLQYLKLLSERLYFHTIADGPGVVHLLLATAEEQEVIEDLLAYRFLWAADGGLTEAELDARVEAWLQDACHQDIDFDAAGAVANLRALGLADGHDRLRVPSIADSMKTLDQRWDDLFRRETFGWAEAAGDHPTS